MSFNNNNCHKAFGSEISSNDDYYIYSSLDDLIIKIQNNKENVFKIRTIGILQSLHGRFCLTDFNSPCSGPNIRISFLYLKTPPPSTIIPYAVQVFGTIQWKNEPTIFVTILQTLSTAMAIRLKNAANSIREVHLARNSM